ncbi:MAG: amidase family protein [Pirellulaceae bacterium]|jgi:aspartyl-tRNA(Asn)/glutamyl-tRNA(Gln) amidotransferase subunit A|nr:amidase family protein [Pirellulaceae bacterium]
MSLTEQTAAELSTGLQAGQFSAVDVTRAFLDRIEQTDQSLRAFLAVRSDRALQDAAEIDKRRAAGASLGPLAGLPVAVKDVVCVRGERTTAGSRMLESYHPPYDATIIDRLRDAGAVLIGKTNMDEYAMGSSTENSAYQVTANPWDVERTPGGSSGGSAAAVAAGQTPLAVGSDTGGSIRQPAAFCGVVGVKPTYGRVSRYGLIAYASSLDQLGPFARTAADAALLLQAISGHDPRDSTSADEPTPVFTEGLAKPLKGLRLGVVGEHFGDGLDAEVAAAVRKAIAVYEALGATCVDVQLPHSRYAIAAYYIIAPCEASSNLARYDGVHYGRRTDETELRKEWRREREELRKASDREGLKKQDSLLVAMYRKSRSAGFGSEVKRRIMLGAYALSAGYHDKYYVKALQIRRLIREDYNRAFGDVDLIIGPVAPHAAYRLGEMVDDPLAMYLGDLYTVGANLAGLPGVSTPCGFTASGLPIGVQLQGSPFSEPALLNAVHQYQQVTDWHERRVQI